LFASRDVYAQKAISQIPRLLSLQDRNPFSPTYGCFHRDYWLDKTSDFPDAVRQFAVHALALVYTYDFPENIYKRQPKILKWIIAALDFWTRIQHRDGSFDEFYPYERGWVGPTGFTTFAAAETVRLLQGEIPAHITERVMTAIQRAAQFISEGQAEEDHLANHHAMACLAVWKAYKLLGDPDLKLGFEKLWKSFLRYHNAEEGWSQEYDGVDPGYLSATVSFLAKIYQSNSDPDLFKVLSQSAEFCSYFVYPNGFYAGSMGSRNTLHFYPHGFEILAGNIPVAAAVAEKMLQALAEGKLVPPEIMSDRYAAYRVSEFLQAYLDYFFRPAQLPLLPYEWESFTRYFSQARIFVASRSRYYTVANLAKGGVTKVFDCQSNCLLLNDCGIIGRLDDDRIVTSQWIDPEYECKVDEQGWEVRGHLHLVPSNKLFTPFKNLLFRSVLILIGWIPYFSHMLKSRIRKTLILGRRPVPVCFNRHLRLENEAITLIDQFHLKDKIRFATLSVGDEFFVRYVPQSRYFQIQELDIRGYNLDESQIRVLRDRQCLSVRRRIRLPDQQIKGADIGVTISTEEGSVITQSSTLSDGRPVIEDAKNLTVDPKQVRYWEKQHNRRHPSDPIIAAFVQPKINYILNHVKISSRAKILDIGCGNGYFTYYFERLGSTVGVDYSKTMLSLNSCSMLIRASAFNLPFPDRTFDLVFCSNLLHHLTNAVTAIIEMKRVSREYVVICEPNRNNPLMLALGLVKSEERQSLRFTTSFLRSLAKQAGLRILACEAMGLVTPNRMPHLIAMMASRLMNSPTLFGAYTVLVAQCDKQAIRMER
jgi:SAM-dependent methyltransferase